MEEVKKLADYCAGTSISGGRAVQVWCTKKRYIPSFAVFALANDERTVRLLVTSSTSSCVFLFLPLADLSRRSKQAWSNS